MRAAPLACAAAAAALAGCGGGSHKGPGEGPPTTVAADTPVMVAATEYKFTPDSIVLSTTSSGPTPVKIDLNNKGAVAHDIHVVRGGQDLGGTPIFGPGQTQEATVTLTPGTYELICTVGDHRQLGMRGKLVVAPPAKSK
jgi:plastocyanin